MSNGALEQALSARDARRAKVEELRARLSEAEQRERMLAHQRRQLLLPAELDDSQAREELAKLEPELEAARRETGDLRDTLSAAQASLAELEYEVRVAGLEEKLAELEGVLADRSKAAARFEKALARAVAAAEEWDRTHTLTVSLGAQAGFIDPDLRGLEKARHLPAAILWAFERFLGPDVPRAHHAFREPFAKLDAGQAAIAERGAERVRSRLAERRPCEEAQEVVSA